MDLAGVRWSRPERFVTAVVAGGLALVIGLWTASLSTATSLPWLVGVGLVAVGLATLAGGIYSQLDL